MMDSKMAWFGTVAPGQAIRYVLRAAAVAGGLKAGLQIWMLWKTAIGAAQPGLGAPKPDMLAMQRKTVQGSGACARAGALRARPKAAVSAKVAEMVRSFMMNISLERIELTCFFLGNLR